MQEVPQLGCSVESCAVPSWNWAQRGLVYALLGEPKRRSFHFKENLEILQVELN